MVESGSSSPSLTSSATLHRPSTRTDKSASSQHIPLVHRTDFIGRFQPCASFGFFQIGHLPFTRITFLDSCQKTVLTHAPRVRNNLFCSETTPISIQGHSSVQLGKTLLGPWPFIFHPHKSNATILLPSFHPSDWAINIISWLCIGSKPPLATALPSFLFQQKP